MVMDKAEGTDQADDKRDEAELSDQTDGEGEEAEETDQTDDEREEVKGVIRQTTKRRRIAEMESGTRNKNSQKLGFDPYQIDTSSPAVVRLNEPLQNRLLVHRFEHCRRGQQHADCAAEGDAEKYPKRKRGIN
ncbi:hypothetical protein niasHS_014579 [Heterodera schachtii]|uniref:Uncharacterized protein n=1 Tax=Heterodera schachtii TaxID=97005 RepID=A0ABD2IL80_HETSC